MSTYQYRQDLWARAETLARSLALELGVAMTPKSYDGRDPRVSTLEVAGDVRKVVVSRALDGQQLPPLVGARLLELERLLGKAVRLQLDASDLARV